MTDAMSHLGHGIGTGENGGRAGVARGGGPRPSGRFGVAGRMRLGGPRPAWRGGPKAA